MNIRTLSSAALIGFALVLSACDVVVTLDPFPSAVEVDATTDPNASTTVSLEAGESAVFEVLLDSSVRNEEAMYFEVDTSDVDMVVYRSSGSPLASSSSSEVFFAGTMAISSVSDTRPLNYDPPDIVVTRFCAGTCVIQDADASNYYMRLINRASAQRTFQMYLFAVPYGDNGEPFNDELAGATTLSSGGFGDGALEDLGDVDYWSIGSTTTLSFSASPPAGLQPRLQLFAPDGTADGEPLAPGDGPIQVFSGDYVEVYELGGDAAGPPNSSLYTIVLD